MVTKDHENYKALQSFSAGNHEFKIANEDYTGQWPINNCHLSLERQANVTVTLDIISNTLTVTYTNTEALVTFLNWDGSVIVNQLVELGQVPCAPTDPVRENDAKNKYTFTSWESF